MFWNMRGLLKMKDKINSLIGGYFSHNEHVSSLDRFKYKFFKNYLKRIEKLESAVSIVIQGPLNNRSIKTIPRYLKYGEVIVSCWNTDNIRLLDPYINKIKVVINNYSDVKKYPSRPGSQAPWIYQHHTTLNGIKVSSSHSIIKVRSDESFPVLDPIIRKLKENRDKINKNTNYYDWHKIITSNIYFRYDREKKFHPSDHIVAGQRNRMLAIFERAERLCRGKLGAKFPEQLLCECVMETYWNPLEKKYEKPNPLKSKELMKKHFDIIRIRDLPNHIWTSSYRKYDALYSEEDWCHDINKI